MSERLGQQVYVENIGGANGSIGVQAVQRAEPDGYTIGVLSDGPMIVNPALYPNNPYQTLRDFVPVAMVNRFPSLLTAHPSTGIKTVADLIRIAKEKPGTLNYSSGGIGNFSHMGLELLAHQTGIKIVHVPYKGVGPATLAVLSGEVQLMYNNVATAHRARAGRQEQRPGDRRIQAHGRPARRADHRRDRAGLRLLGLDRHLCAGQDAGSGGGEDFEGDRRVPEGPGDAEILQPTSSSPRATRTRPQFSAYIKDETDQVGRRREERRHQGAAVMYSLHLSAEQIEFRDTVRSFVDDEIKPVVLNANRLDIGDRALPMDVLDKASQMGLRTLALAEELGGVGADALTCCIVTEELAAGDAGIATVLAETSALGLALFGAMTNAQRDAFLPAFLEDDRYHLAYARPRAGHRHGAGHRLSPHHGHRAPGADQGGAQRR